MTVDGIPNHGLGRIGKATGHKQEAISPILQTKGEEEIIATVSSNLPPLQPEDLNKYFHIMSILKSSTATINQKDWLKPDSKFQAEDIETAERTTHSAEEIRLFIERFPSIDHVSLHAIVDFTKEFPGKGNIALIILFTSQLKKDSPSLSATDSLNPKNNITKLDFFKNLINHISKTAHFPFSALINVDGSDRDDFCHVPPSTDINMLCKEAEKIDLELSQTIRKIFNEEVVLDIGKPSESNYTARLLFNGSVLLVNLLKNHKSLLPTESNLPNPASIPKIDPTSLPELIIELNKLEHAALNISKLQPLPSQINLEEAKELVLQASKISPASGNAVYLFFCKNRITSSSIAAVKNYLPNATEDKSEKGIKSTRIQEQYEDAIKRLAAGLKDTETEFILGCKVLDLETLDTYADTPTEKALVFVEAIKEINSELAAATETVSYKQSPTKDFDDLGPNANRESINFVIAGLIIADTLKQLYSKNLLQCTNSIEPREQPETQCLDIIKKLSIQNEYSDKLTIPTPSRCITGEKLVQEILGQGNYQGLKREQLEQYATEIIDRAGPSLCIPSFLRPRVYVDEQSGKPKDLGEEIGMMIGMRKQGGQLISPDDSTQKVIKFEYFVSRGDELYGEFPLYKPDSNNLEEFLEKTYQKALMYYQRMFEFILPKEEHINAYSEGIAENIRSGKIFADSLWLSPSLRKSFADFVENNLPKSCTTEFVQSLEEYFSNTSSKPIDGTVNQVRSKLFDLILEEQGIPSPHIGASIKVDILLRQFLGFTKQGAHIVSEKEDGLSRTFQEASKIEDNEPLKNFAYQCVRNNSTIGELTQKLHSGLNLAQSFGIPLSDERLLLYAFHPLTAELKRFAHLHVTKILENELAKIPITDDHLISSQSELREKLDNHKIRIEFYKDGHDFLNAYYLFRAYPNSKDAAQELVSKGKQLLNLLPETNPLNRVINNQVNNALVLLDKI